MDVDASGGRQARAAGRVVAKLQELVREDEPRAAASVRSRSLRVADPEWIRRKSPRKAAGWT